MASRASTYQRARSGVLCILVICTFLIGFGGAPSARASAPLALINGDTVGGSPSAEETLATGLGFTVTVVSGATWATMTQAQFAQYQVLIAGDGPCGPIAGSLIASESTWAPVVMGTAVNTKPGNRVVVGTDPVLHSGGSGPRTHVIEDGIAFAGAQPGRTGLYFDTSCGGNYYGQTGVAASMLGQLSTGTGAWTEDDNPPCGGAVAKIASTPQFNSLTTSDLEGWGCSVHEAFPTFASDWSALAIATDTASHPTCGTDNTVSPPATACGEAYVLISGSGIVTTSPNISLTPSTATNPVGTTHTVTANVTVGGAAVVGQLVTFTVTGQNGGATGTCAPADCRTDSSGNVSFTYTGANGAGDDTIAAQFTDSNGTTQQATAAKHWVGVVDPPITAAGTTFPATEGASASGAVATFTDPDAAATAGEYSASIVWGDGTAASAGAVVGTAGTFTVNGTHTYAEEGSFAVTVTIADIDNAANTATVTTAATVADAALTASGTTLNSPNPVNAVVATFTDADPNGTVSDYTASINWGDGTPNSAGAVGTNGTGFNVTGTHTYAALGQYLVKTHICDVGGSCADANTNILMFAFSSGGSFVVGDKSATGSVTFWGAQWWKVNSLSAGSAPAAFKGFENNPVAPACGVSWTTNPGNSAGPPASIPTYMAVVVSSSISQSGSTISGNDVHVVIVKTNPGYASDPGHAGTGTVVATLC